MEADYYKILNVREDASEEEIKRAYRDIAKKYHPDANEGNHGAAERFKEASEAYAAIGTWKSRKEYDSRRTVERTQRNGRAGSRQAQKGSRTAEGHGTGGSAPDIDFSNVAAGFEQFFGFHPKTKEVREEKLNPDKKTKTNPMDMTDLFERYMNIKKK